MEYHIPTLNEKPTTKELLGAVPFITAFIYRAAPKAFLIWLTSSILVIPFTALSVFAVKSAIDGLDARDFDSTLTWFILLLVSYAMIGLSRYIVDVQTDVIRFRIEYASNESVIRLMSSLSFSVLERMEFRILCDAFQRKAYVVLNIAQWVFYGLYHLSVAIGASMILFLLPWQASLILFFRRGYSYLHQQAGSDLAVDALRS